ncbi:MAG TPA: helix-turn-helix transcriptional regulator [Verrucomicrobiae bacterium]|nr:helix-turn-helix transcriptional regulator [Verrucomicrobiae bacterium]
MSTSKDDAYRVFTVNFRMLLEATGWTQMEAAEQLGISQGSVSDCQSGKRMLSTKGIESIAYRLGLPAELLTTKPLSLENMKKLLSGNRSPKVAERRGIYRVVRPYDPWFRSLKHRWKRSPGCHDEIRIAVRVLFGGETPKVIDWLEEK